MFKTCAVYPRVRPFWIYTTVSFFKELYSLSLCVCVKKYLVFSQKKKLLWKMLWIFLYIAFFFWEVLHSHYFSQQILGIKLLLILIWTHYWNYFFAINDNMLFRICCESVMKNVVNIVFLFFIFLFFIWKTKREVLCP